MLVKGTIHQGEISVLIYMHQRQGHPPTIKTLMVLRAQIDANIVIAGDL
jgi:hypothetical protein